MSDPMTYTFYGATIPTLRNLTSSAISVLTTAQNEIANAPSGTFPSEQELLDSTFGDMLPFRVQPILMAKFPFAGITHLNLNGSTPIPAMNPGFADFAAVIDFLKQIIAVYDAIDAKTFNESAGKSVDLTIESANKTLNMTGLADYYHGFAVPNTYFHVNAMYMLLRAKGFKLGKGSYIASFMSEQLKKDWAPLRG
jgi:uncharacterized protein